MARPTHCLTLSALLALASTSAAELVDRGTTTYDTETGLEWLDVTETLNVSAYDILVLGYGGYVASGWTLGTVEQIGELFLHAGIPLPHDGQLSSAGFAGASQLIGLLGATGTGMNSVYIQAFSGTLVPSSGFVRYTPVVLTSGTIGGADLLGASVPSSVQSPTIGNYLVRCAGPTTLTVSIDVRPFSSTNLIRPLTRGLIPVGLLTDPKFQALEADPSSIRFGPSGAAPVFGQGVPVDLDADGDLDLLFLFWTLQSGIACGDTTARLTGSTAGGTPFEGVDRIVTVGCGG